MPDSLGKKKTEVSEIIKLVELIAYSYHKTTAKLNRPKFKVPNISYTIGNDWEDR